MRSSPPPIRSLCSCRAGCSHTARRRTCGMIQRCARPISANRTRRNVSVDDAVPIVLCDDLNHALCRIGPRRAADLCTMGATFPSRPAPARLSQLLETLDREIGTALATDFPKDRNIARNPRPSAAGSLGDGQTEALGIGCADHRIGLPVGVIELGIVAIFKPEQSLPELRMRYDRGDYAFHIPASAAENHEPRIEAG